MRISLLKYEDQKLPKTLRINHSEPDSTEIISRHLLRVFTSIAKHRDLVIVCVGTDRSTGDALGPLVGTNLCKINNDKLHVYGTLSDPVHALNLNDHLALIAEKHYDPFIIAIDACLGQMSSVGHIHVGDGPVKPGAGVNKDLPPVGNMHITGVVNVGGFMEYFVLQNTRLSLVVNLAEIIANAIYISFMNSCFVKPSPYLQLD